MFFGSCVLCECCSKGVGGQPDPAVAVGLEFWCLRVWGVAVENVGDGFALAGSQSGDVDQGLNARVICRADNSAGVGMAGKNHGSFGSVDGSLDRIHVVVERGQRDGRGGDGDPRLL